FRGFTAYQGATILAASGSDSCHHRLDHHGIELAEGDVIEKKERERTLYENVVDAVVDQISPDGVVTIGIYGNLDLRPHSIRTRDENWLAQARGNADHAAEPAEAADNARSGSGFDQLRASSF